MAVGFDLTPFLNFGGENVIALRTDNDWRYKERSTGSLFQWNDRNFNANYGGVPKNVWLHITDKLYQTLPLYSNLQTTGTYIYASDIKVRTREAVVHAESQVRNEYGKSVHVDYEVSIYRQYIPGTTDDSAVRRNGCIESFCTIKRSSFLELGVRLFI